MRFKRFLAIFLALATVMLPLSACTSDNSQDDRIYIIATNFALYDFAKAVCGDYCKVEMLIPLGSESHDFEATFSDMAKVADADLFIYVGGESEEWVDDMFRSMGKDGEGVRKLRALDYVKTYTEGKTDEADHDHGEHVVDEHIWTSIPNAITIIGKIAEELNRIDEKAFDYIDSDLMTNYVYELIKLNEEYKYAVSTGARKTIVVADRFPFRYLVEEYGLEYYAAFDGCSSDTEPSLSTINSLVEVVKEEKIPVIFIIEFSDGATANAIADATGAKIMTLQSAHNVSKTDFNRKITYLDIMRDNLNALKEALN